MAKREGVRRRLAYGKKNFARLFLVIRYVRKEPGMGRFLFYQSYLILEQKKNMRGCARSFDLFVYVCTAQSVQEEGSQMTDTLLIVSFCSLNINQEKTNHHAWISLPSLHLFLYGNRP